MSTPIRVATFNASLNRGAEGQLVTDLSTPDNAQAKTVAEIIQRTDADIILINEFDYVANQQAATLFQDNYLSVGQNGAAPVEYGYVYVAPSNTGIPSGFDLDNNGVVGGPNDAFGFGFFPGQFGMVVYSKHPIVAEDVRTFQNFLWKDMPGALLPDDPATPEPQDWYSPEELEVFRLSSKSHWDIPVDVNGEIVHVLASHPTPPVFDGPEDRNGTRNHDEIRLWADYVTPGKAGYIYDDAGDYGGLGAGERFVIVGDQNADPLDGDSVAGAIQQLLDNPQVDASVIPDSPGGPQQAALQGGANAAHTGDPAYDTADFADGTPGNLRADYVLPSVAGLTPVDGSVFWPLNTDPLFSLAGTFPFPSSDHRLVEMELTIDPLPEDLSRKTIAEISFIGEATFATGYTFDGTQVGGLSGITYDAANGQYFAIADDRSQFNPARYYTLTIDLGDGSLDDGDVVFTDVTTLLQPDGTPFPALSIDPEGIALTSSDTLFISSEGDGNALINPFVNEFSLGGQQFAELPVPEFFNPTTDKSQGIRNNLAFESLTISPDGRFLFTATENALYQDGPPATLDGGSPSRILKYDLATGELVAQYIYETDPVADAPVPPGSFSTNGLVELIALDNVGTMLALERSFSNGVGNSVKLYQVQLDGATNLDGIEQVGGFEIDQIARKTLLLDFGTLGITLDNLEAMALGPTLADGSQSLIVASDNNFSPTQFTQFLAFSVDIDTIPTAQATVETPNETTGDADPDDPAIYLNAADASLSFVITTGKNAGLVTYDLAGQPLQVISPDDIRYNNVDLIYDFALGGQAVDLAVVSDRANDTLAIFRIDAAARTLTDITSTELSAAGFSIFGVDDGEATAYGLATYKSFDDGQSYAFATQADGNLVAQLRLFDAGGGTVGAEVVRTIELPVADGDDPEDSQSEGIVVDRETGQLYVATEDSIGILRYSAAPDGGNDYKLIAPVGAPVLAPDIEGLSLYYGANGSGYLIASSQGDNTFAVYERQGNNAFVGSFAIGPSGLIDGVEETDGIDITNVGLGAAFPQGLVVVQDGSNEPQIVIDDDGEWENANANFKFVPWQDIADAFTPALIIDPSSYDPRAEGTTGTDGADKLKTGSADDLIQGFGGDDTVQSGSGNDTVYGGAGDDTISAGSGNDRVWAGDGNDTVLGGSGNDTVAAGGGDDEVNAGSGNDTVDGGSGDDTLAGADGNDSLQGGEGDDEVGGGAGNDVLRGFDGDDVISGGDGRDRMFGGSGDDILDGGAGADTLRGGPGDDVFVLRAGEGGDLILDFRPGSDLIGLAGGLTFDDLTLTELGDDETLIFADDELLATVEGSELTDADFLLV